MWVPWTTAFVFESPPVTDLTDLQLTIPPTVAVRT